MRAPRLAVTVAAGALLATLVAAGGAGAVTPTRSAAARPAVTTVGAATTTKYYLQQSGTGNKTLGPVTLPSKWYLEWKFDCGAKKGSFVITSTRHGQAATTVTNQLGLGGGGQQPFTRSGSYRFGVKTSCTWKITASNILPPVAK